MKAAAGAYERKDFTAALAVWRPLAEAGNAEAETLLGAMYWSGEGVLRDHKQAAYWYLRAAGKGYARAQNDIGYMYGFGEGVPPRDNVQAYKWLSLAVRNYYGQEPGAARAGDQGPCCGASAHDASATRRCGAADTRLPAGTVR